MLEFFAMGGYAVYVWCSYGVTAAVLLYHFVAPLVHEKNIREQLRQQP